MATYWEVAAHSAYDMFFLYYQYYLTVNSVFSHLSFWSGNLFLIAPFADQCLLSPFLHFKVSIVPELLQILTNHRYFISIFHSFDLKKKNVENFISIKFYFRIESTASSEIFVITIFVNIHEFVASQMQGSNL